MSMKRESMNLRLSRVCLCRKLDRCAKARLRKKSIMLVSDTSDDAPSSLSPTRTRSVTPQPNSSSLQSSLASPLSQCDVQLSVHSRCLASPMSSSTVSLHGSPSPSLSCSWTIPVDSESNSEDESNQLHF